MKYKIYLVASLLLGNVFFGFSQSKSEKVESIPNDSVKTRGGAVVAASAGETFQKASGIYGFGATETTDIQKVGGASNNFNAIIPGRDATITNSIEKANASSRASVLRSNGPMYIAETDGSGDSTTMAVFGTAYFDMRDTITKMGQAGNIDLYGDFIAIDTIVNTTANHALYQTGDKVVGNTFNPEGNKAVADYANQGLITFKGSWNVQRIDVETEDGLPILNNEASRSFNSILNLPRVKVSKEAIAGLSGVSSHIVDTDTLKAYDPYRMGFVSVGSNAAVSINELDLTGGNRLSVDAISSGLEAVAVANASGTTTTASADQYYKVNFGYLDINSQVKPSGTVKDGFGELNMRLYSFDPTNEDNTQGDDTFLKTSTSAVTEVFSGSGARNAVFLRGFTSPFDELHADYMLYNVLTKPEGSRMTGDDGTITKPETQINAGEGYFFALDVSNSQFDRVSQINKLGDNGSNSRARGGYNFSRYLREYQFTPGLNDSRFVYNSSTRKYGYDPTYALNFYTFEDESFTAANNPQRFNTGNIEVAVKGGTSYSAPMPVLLGNPYLVPINIGGILWDGEVKQADLDGLKGKTDDATIGYTELFYPKFNGVENKSFQVLVNANDQVPPTAGLVIRSKYRPVNSARVIDIDDKYYFNVSYDEVELHYSAMTATTVGDVSANAQYSHYLEPLQLFGIYAVGEGKFTFTPDMKTNGITKTAAGNVVGQPFRVQYIDPKATRSSVAETADAEVNQVIVPDWFVIEASVSNDVLATDRTAVRFMNSGSQSYKEYRDVIKNVKYLNEGDKIFEDDKTKALVRSTQSTMNVENAVYTTALDGTPLKSNTTDYASTKEIPLYYVPSKNGGETTLNFAGVSGFQDINKAYLVDRYTNTKKELVEGLSYSFDSSTGNQDTANRFLLVFDDTKKDDNNLPSTNFVVYYTESVLHIDGLNDQDAGSIVQIFDVQGRTMGTSTISSGEASVGSKEYPKPLGLGTFIVKIIGKRNYNSKFVNTQNI